MPRKGRSSFTHRKTGRFHRERGGAGRGFIAGRAQTPDLLVGELRSPSPSPSASPSSASASLDASNASNASCTASPSTSHDVSDMDSLLSTPSAMDGDGCVTDESTEFLHALASPDSENEARASSEAGSQFPSKNLIDQTANLLKAVLPNHWSVIPKNGGFNIVKLSTGNDPAIQRNIFISFTGSVRITVHRKPITPELFSNFVGEHTDCLTLTDQSQKLFVDRALAIVLRVRSFEICAGVDSQTYCDMWGSDSSGKVDENPYDESRYHKTFRPTACSLLVPVENWRCSECKKSNERMNKRFKNFCKEEAEKCTRNDLLNPKQAAKKMHRQQREIKNTKRKVDYLSKIKFQLQTEGVMIDSEISEDLTEVLRDAEMNPIQHLFLQQQLHYSSLSDKRGMRWHPAMIRFALLLRSAAGIGGYDAIRQSGVIHLPHDRTLFDYSHAVPRSEGVFTEKLNHLQEPISKLNEEYQQFHNLLVDEIHIAQKLVYRKSDGKLVGYVNLSEVESELKLLEDKLNGTAQNEPIVAKCILAYLIKGVCNSVKEVVAAFPVACLKKEQLYERTWEVISACEIRSIKILAVVSDGCAVNRAFIAMHTPATVSDLHSKIHKTLVFNTVNLCAPHRLLFFIADPPHLLKTIRNCLAKSGQGKKCTRLLTKGGQFMTWKTIERLFVSEVGNTLRKCYKLTSQNVYLNSYTCMNVAYAGQVMSNTVGLALKEKEWPGTENLADFIISVNNFFDNLNGAHTNMGKRTANSRLDPYTSVDDKRFDELRAFEKELLAWEAEVGAAKVKDNVKEKMLLSRQTLEGIYITINGFIGAVQYMLGIGAKFINARVFCQDPLEQYFSKQRGAGGGQNSVTVLGFLNTDTKITLTRDYNVRRKSSNVEGVSKMLEASNEPLPKRKKSK